MSPTVYQLGVGDVGGAQVWGSNWGFATGTSDNALKDGDGSGGNPYRWINTLDADHAQVFEVVPGTDFGWTRTANVLRIKKPSVDAFLQWQVIAGSPPNFTGSTFILPTAAEVGSGYFLRHYRRVNSTSTGNNHGDTNRTATINRVWWAAPTVSGATYTMHVGLNRSTKDGATGPADTPTFQDYYLSPALPTNEFLRIEEHLEVVEVISSTSVRTQLHVEVYDLGGALLADDDDFTHTAGGGRTLTFDYGDGQQNCEYPNADAGSLTMGWETITPNANDLCQVAAIAVSTESWCRDRIEDW